MNPILERQPLRDSIRTISAHLRAAAEELDHLSDNSELPIEVLSLIEQLMRALSATTERPRLEIETVITGVCEFSGVPRKLLLSGDRRQHISFVRQVAMYLCRELLPDKNNSFPLIGKYFGRDHSTIIHGHALIRRRIERDAAFMQALKSLEDRLTRPASRLNASATAQKQVAA